MIGSTHSTQPVDYFTQSFALQYISLILFILIFSIAAFLPKPDEETKVAEVVLTEVEASPAEKQPEVIEVAKFPISDLFLPSRSELNQEAWEGFRSVLTSHDINFSLTVYWGSRIGLDTALTRADNVISFLLSIKIPESAIAVSVARSELTDEGTIVLTRESK